MASNCEDIISMDVKITLLNPGGWWTRQFSVDEQGLLPMFACYIAVYSVGTLAYVYLRGSRLLKHSISPLEWLFIAALALEVLSVFLQTTHGVARGGLCEARAGDGRREAQAHEFLGSVE
jgi:hypothetical protein